MVVIMISLQNTNWTNGSKLEILKPIEVGIERLQVAIESLLLVAMAIKGKKYRPKMTDL